MSLKFYTDTHINRAVAVQLRARGITAIRCEEVGLAEASDEEHLEYASQADCVMVSQDTDFRDLHYDWMAQGKSHAGIFLVPKFVRGSGLVSVVVRECAAYYDLIEKNAGTIESDVANQLVELKV